jgi:hypothetical protein
MLLIYAFMFTNRIFTKGVLHAVIFFGCCTSPGAIDRMNEWQGKPLWPPQTPHMGWSGLEPGPPP